MERKHSPAEAVCLAQWGRCADCPNASEGCSLKYTLGIAIRPRSGLARRSKPRRPSPDFIRALKELRLARGLSQFRLSSRAGFCNTYIQYVENGEYSPTLEEIAILARVLDADPASLAALIEKETA